MNRHKKIFKILEKVAAATEPVAAARIAAAVVIKNNIISIGFNQWKTHPFQAKFSNHNDAIHLHAENHALVNALRSIPVEHLEKASIYVCRIKANNQWGMSKPCSGCMRAIASLNVKNVFYTEEGNKFASL